MMETILFSFAEVKMAQNPAYKPAAFFIYIPFDKSF